MAKSALDELILRQETSKIKRVKKSISLLFYRYKTKLVNTFAVISGKRFSANKRYKGASHVTQDMVEIEPEKWIIKECIPACKILWSKNIFTFMCSDYVDYDAWIELDLDVLSNENLEILEQIKLEYECFSYHQGCINIKVTGMGKKAQSELIKIANRFKMQDVPHKYAVISLEELLMSCGCFSLIKNPDYVSVEEQMAKMDFENWRNVEFSEPTIRVFDSLKVVKPVEEYIADYGAVVSEDGTIYVDQFYYDKHLNYVFYLNDNEQIVKR